MALTQDKRSTIGMDREAASLTWFTASDPIATEPGADTSYHCRIYVPFAHRLQDAYVTNTDVDKTGTITVTLLQADDTDAKAGTAVGTAITPSAATADVVTVNQVTLANSDKAAVTAGRCYFLSITGTNAADRFEEPTLTIGVTPTAQSRL